MSSILKLKPVDILISREINLLSKKPSYTQKHK